MKELVTPIIELATNSPIEFFEKKRREALTRWKDHCLPDNPYKFSRVHEIFQAASLATEQIFEGLGYWQEITNIIKKHDFENSPLSEEDVRSVFITSRLSPLEQIAGDNGDRDWEKLLVYSAVYQEISLLQIKNWVDNRSIDKETLTNAEISYEELEFIVDISLKISAPGAKIFLAQHLIVEDEDKEIPKDWKDYAFGTQFLYKIEGKFKTIAQILPEEIGQITKSLVESSDKVETLGERYRGMKNYLSLLAKFIGIGQTDPQRIEETLQQLQGEALKIYDYCPLLILTHTSWQGSDGDGIDHSISVNWTTDKARQENRAFESVSRLSAEISNNLGYPGSPPVLFATNKLIQTGQGIASYTQGDPDDLYIYESLSTIELTSQMRIKLLRQLFPDLPFSDEEIHQAILKQIYEHELSHETPKVDSPESPIKKNLGLAEEPDGGKLTDRLDELRSEFLSFVFTYGQEKEYLMSFYARLSEYVFCLITEKGDPDYLFPAQACLYYLTELGSIGYDSKIRVSPHPEEGLIVLAIAASVITNTHYIPEIPNPTKEMVDANRGRTTTLMDAVQREINSALSSENHPFSKIVAAVSKLNLRIPRYHLEKRLLISPQ